MATNDKADHHYLTDKEIAFFKRHVNAVNEKIAQIVYNQRLKGIWTISSDLKWLVKKGE